MKKRIPTPKKTFWTCWSKCEMFDQECKTQCVDVNQACLNNCPCSNPIPTPTTTTTTTTTTTKPLTCEEKYKLEIVKCKGNCEKSFWTCWNKCGMYDQNCKSRCVDVSDGCLYNCPCATPPTTTTTTTRNRI